MSIIERALPVERAAILLASGLCYSLADLALKLLIHLIWGEYGAWDFRAGSLVGFFGAAVVGMLIALPTAFAKSGRVVSLALGIVLLVFHAFAYFAYADTGHLPTVASLFGFAASADLGVVAWSASLGGLATLGYGLGAPLLERRLRTRLASVGVRIADFATIFLFALFGLGTIIAGTGPVYYGVMPPAAHLAVGRVQERADPLPPEANVHSHDHDHSDHRHEHGFVPRDETVEPFPADGIPRPAESMRLQYQGLLGTEAFLPIADTAYPYCRRESEVASLERPHDVVVVNLSGLSRERAREALPWLDEAPRPALSFERFHAVTVDRVTGRRALLTGLPPTVSRRYVPDVPELPSAAFLPRYPSLATTLASYGAATAYFGPDPGALGLERLELTGMGFDRLSFGEEAPASTSADDLETLARLGAHLRARAEAPRIAFVELRSLAEGGEPDPRLVAELEALVRSSDDTTVIFTSDHVAGSEASAEAAELGLPFVVVGEGLPEGAEISDRLGAAYDLPLTALGLLGATRRHCHQGRDLLGTSEAFPERRVALAQVGAEGTEFVLIEARSDEYLRWNIDGSNPLAKETPASLFDLSIDLERKNDLFSRRDPDWPQLDELWKSHLAVGIYLLRTDRFASPMEGMRPEPKGRPAQVETARVRSVERVPAEGGRYLVPARVFDGGASPAELLSRKRRGSEVTFDLRAKRFGTRAALEAWLGARARDVDALLLDDLGMATALAERDVPAVGVWLRPSMGERGALFSQLAGAGIDFVMMPFASASAIRRARAWGLEVWVPRSRLETLEDVSPDVVVD